MLSKYWVGFIIFVSGVVGFVSGAEWDTPVYDITEVVYTANPHRMRMLDGVVCYFSPMEK